MEIKDFSPPKFSDPRRSPCAKDQGWLLLRVPPDCWGGEPQVRLVAWVECGPCRPAPQRQLHQVATVEASPPVLRICGSPLGSAGSPPAASLIAPFLSQGAGWGHSLFCLSPLACNCLHTFEAFSGWGGKMSHPGLHMSRSLLSF